MIKKSVKVFKMFLLKHAFMRHLYKCYTQINLFSKNSTLLRAIFWNLFWQRDAMKKYNLEMQLIIVKNNNTRKLIFKKVIFS